MSHYPDYKKATNAAYELLALKISFSLATNVFAIVEDLLDNCKLLTYGQACFLYGYTPEMLLEASKYGFSIVHRNRRIILYNETVPLGCIRFTIAHEIGHFILKHRDEHDPSAEKEANCFARNLLCPIPVVSGMSLETIQDYVSLFDVTTQMATVSFDRQSSDKYYISSENWNLISEMLDAYMMGFANINEYHQFLAS
nr:ImmA/IrrE family metallo-endopeptidase [uncultured Dysosmobacter sp.]